MKKYKPCEVCDCEDCKKGTYRHGSWLCPVLNMQICEVCCCYDMDAIDVWVQGKKYKNFRNKCDEVGCRKHI